MLPKKGLGRGLSALIKDGTTEKKQPASGGEPAGRSGAVMVPVDQIRRNKLQPRKKFTDEALTELAESIKVHGVIQPLLVRKDGAAYELIAGERRLRASGRAGLKEVPVIIIEAEDKASLELALVENLQRENLDAMEEAEGYQALADKFTLTQEEIATRVGKSRVTVTNSLRLLTLPSDVKALISTGQLSAGHAKVLLGLESDTDIMLLAKRTVTESLSVRVLESLVKKAKRAPKKPRAVKSDIPKEHLVYLVSRMHTHFGTSVRIEPTQTFANGKKKKGKIEIDFFSNDDLDRLLQMLGINLD
jgi:ParB family chromosome partitioning protein